MRPNGPNSHREWWTQDDTDRAVNARLQAAQERTTVLLDIYSDAQILGGQPELADLSAAEIEALPMRAFGALRERAGLVNHDPYDVTDDTPAGPPVAAPQSAPQAPQNQPQGIDVNNLSMSDYAALRGQLGIGQGRQEGRGIFNAASRQPQLDGTRARAGRGALSSGNVTPAPSLTGRQERQGDTIDHRTRAGRFTFPGSAYQG